MEGAAGAAASFLADDRVVFGVRVTEVRGARAADDRGAGLLVRVDRLGVAILEGAGDALDGGLLLSEADVGAGAGDDSFRRLAGGFVAVGDGVGRDFAAGTGSATMTLAGTA